MHRSTRAFLLAPLVPVLLFVTCISAAGLFSGGPTLAPAVAYSAPIWMIFAAPVSYGVAVVFGIPGFLLFRRLGWLTMRCLVGGAAVLGLLVGVGVSAGFASDTVCSMLAVTLTFGAVSGYVFWWLSRPHAPSNSLQGRRP
mgnify:CR=1 FL=1